MLIEINVRNSQMKYIGKTKASFWPWRHVH